MASDRREFLMLAHDYDPIKYSCAGWYVSEKLDGRRCWWDGGVTRGLAKVLVPWANNTSKDDRYKQTPYATGLWSRYGHPIMAPEWWLNKLPPYFLDGELYCGRGKFQLTESITRTLIPDDIMWKFVKYMVFDSPLPEQVFQDGQINNPNFRKLINKNSIMIWLSQHGMLPSHSNSWFEQTYNWLKKFQANEVVELLPQEQLPFYTADAKKRIEEELDRITDLGGEGLILRNPTSIWTPKRVYHMLKVKKMLDTEAVVVGYTSGRKTDKGSKLLGLMGALILDYQGKRLELSGFTDEERQLTGFEEGMSATCYAELNSGMDMPDWVENKFFPRGSKITLRYRELTDDGIPREARYYRKRLTD